MRRFGEDEKYPARLDARGNVQIGANMEIIRLVQELGEGMLITAEIFVLTLVFFPAARFDTVIRKNVQNRRAPFPDEDLHIDYERNPADASVDGSVFRTILSVWNAHFHRIPYDCGADRFCD